MSQKDNNLDVMRELANDEELKPALRAALMMRVMSAEGTPEKVTNPLLSWLPIYLTIGGMFISGVTVYSNTMTRLALLETRLDIIQTMQRELREDIRTSKPQQQQQKRNGD